MDKYSWAVNATKLGRAIKVLTDAATLKATLEKSAVVVPTEEEIKAQYIKFAGLVLQDAPEKVKEAVKAKKAR